MISVQVSERKWLSAVPILAIALAFAGPVLARGPGGHGDRLERAVERLDLDDATRTAVFATIDAARATRRELRSTLAQERDALRTLVEADETSEEALFAQVDTIQGIESELRKHELRTLLQVRSQLDTDAREQLREAMERRHRGFRGKRSCDG